MTGGLARPGACGQVPGGATEPEVGTVGAEHSLFVVHNSPIKTPGLRDANLAHMIGVRKENEHGESPHWALSLARRVHKWAG
jgi:hypothetical protein